MYIWCVYIYIHIHTYIYIYIYIYIVIIQCEPNPSIKGSLQSLTIGHAQTIDMPLVQGTSFREARFEGGRDHCLGAITFRR